MCLVPGTIIEKHSGSQGDGDPLLYNVAYFISHDGTVLGSYRKKNIWHPERPHLTSSGQERHEAIDTPLGRIGMLVCWDLAFPEAFRELIADGAEIIIIPTFCMVSFLIRFHLHSLKFQPSKYTAHRTRSRENKRRERKKKKIAKVGKETNISNFTPTPGTPHDAPAEARRYNPDSESLFLNSTLTSRCFENTCGIIFVNAAGPQEDFLGMSQVTLPVVGPISKMGTEEGLRVVDMNLDLLGLAEKAYKVRYDIGREDWHYKYRHSFSK